MKKPQKPVHRGTSGAAKGGGRKGGGKGGGRHRIGGGAGVVAGGGSAAAPVKRKPAKGKGGGKKGSPSGAKVHVHHHHPKRKLSVADVACCSAEALAATLRLAGHQVDDSEVLALYWATASDPGEGASMQATLEATAEYGLAGIRPASFRPATELAPGVLAGGWLPGGPHAVTLDGAFAWTWGERRPARYPFLAAIDEAWEVRW